MAHAAHSSLEDACSSHLMVVTRLLGLNNVLITGEGISVVHIAKTDHELVHSEVVGVFLNVNHFRLLFYDVIVASTERQLELIVNNKVGGLNT